MRVLILFAFAVVLTSCADATVVPSPPAYRPPAPAPVVPVTPPAAPKATVIAIYQGPDDLYAAYTSYLNGAPSTRYLMYADSTFDLEFVSPRFGVFMYGGRVSRTNADVRFDFDGWNTAGPWTATGTLVGDSLKVRYNDIMAMSDFVSGTYVRVP